MKTYIQLYEDIVAKVKVFYEHLKLHKLEKRTGRKLIDQSLWYIANYIYSLLAYVLCAQQAPVETRRKLTSLENRTGGLGCLACGEKGWAAGFRNSEYKPTSILRRGVRRRKAETKTAYRDNKSGTLSFLWCLMQFSRPLSRSSLLRPRNR